MYIDRLSHSSLILGMRKKQISFAYHLPSQNAILIKVQYEHCLNSYRHTGLFLRWWLLKHYLCFESPLPYDIYCKIWELFHLCFCFMTSLGNLSLEVKGVHDKESDSNTGTAPHCPVLGWKVTSCIRLLERPRWFWIVCGRLGCKVSKCYCNLSENEVCAGPKPFWNLGPICKIDFFLERKRGERFLFVKSFSPAFPLSPNLCNF